MYIKILIVTYVLLKGIKCLELASIEFNYNKGLEAYEGERWSECIDRFEESLHLYKLYRSITSNCGFKCSTQKSASTNNFEELQIYKLFLERSVCLQQCLNKGFQDARLSDNVSEKILSNIKFKKPYEYLHLCYFQMYMLPKAATAAYTYLIANPDDRTMMKNYQYYIEQPEVDQKDVTDLESLDFVILCKLGKKSYDQKNWGETIAAMEEALNEYIHYENDCRFECEEHTHTYGGDHFINVVASNVEYILNCKQNCQDEVKQLFYASGSEFIADVLNYLQISYYRSKRIEDGAKCVASYLLIYPNDEDMNENKKIYSSLIDESAFIVRNDIVNYIERDNAEKKLLKFIQSNSELYENNHLWYSNTGECNSLKYKIYLTRRLFTTLNQHKELMVETSRSEMRLEKNKYVPL